MRAARHRSETSSRRRLQSCQIPGNRGGNPGTTERTIALKHAGMQDKLQETHALLSNTRQPGWLSSAVERNTTLKHAGRQDELWSAHALLETRTLPRWEPGASPSTDRTITLGHAGRHLINFHRGRKQPYPPEAPQEGSWIYDERPIYGPVYQEAAPGGGIIQQEPMAFP